MVAAENLRWQLEERLINKTAHDAWGCGCGRCGAGPSRVVGIDVPMEYQYQIAMWMLWSCKMEDNTGKGWSQGITGYIPLTELHPMFRQAFAGIDKGLPEYDTSEALIACNVDALEFEQRHGRGQGRYSRLTGGAMFYICIPGHGCGQDIYLPIARVVAV